MYIAVFLAGVAATLIVEITMLRIAARDMRGTD